jgi:hypothetical protein
MKEKKPSILKRRKRPVKPGRFDNQMGLPNSGRPMRMFENKGQEQLQRQRDLMEGLRLSASGQVGEPGGPTPKLGAVINRPQKAENPRQQMERIRQQQEAVRSQLGDKRFALYEQMKNKITGRNPFQGSVVKPALSPQEQQRRQQEMQAKMEELNKSFKINPQQQAAQQQAAQQPQQAAQQQAQVAQQQQAAQPQTIGPQQQEAQMKAQMYQTQPAQQQQPKPAEQPPQMAQQPAQQPEESEEEKKRKLQAQQMA